MAWEKVSDELSQLLEDTLNELDLKPEKRKMVGCPTYFINNNMFCGVHQHNILMRFSEQDREAIFREYEEAVLFEPIPGRKMKEYVSLPESIFRNQELFKKWLLKSQQFVSSLPPKPKKPKKK